MKVSLMMSLAALVLVACGSGSAALSPLASTNAAVGSGRSASWMSPLANAENLLYVSNRVDPDVTVYSWDDQKLVGTLKGFRDPRGECVDKAGNVFITDAGTSQILEYAHGGTSPIATLDDGGHIPLDCSVDAVTGNLAVTDFGDGGGSVIIYPNATGRPSRHFNLHFAAYDYCGYDDSGNLFIDGTNHLGHFIFSELPSGGGRFIDIALHRIVVPGPVKWDGKYVAVGEVGRSISEFSISGSTATHVGTTDLGDANPHIMAFWIPKFGENRVNPQGKHIVAASHFNDRFEPGVVQIWAYPAGGAPRHTIHDSISRPEGVTVSPHTK